MRVVNAGVVIRCSVQWGPDLPGWRDGAASGLDGGDGWSVRAGGYWRAARAAINSRISWVAGTCQALAR